MSVEIIVDSASDITREYANQLGVTLLPITITFGETSYIDTVDLDHDGFFRKLMESKELPKTSQVLPFTYEEHFKAARDRGNEVVCIVLSSKLSGCYQSACIAAMEMDGVYVIDSENACFGERLLVELAVIAREHGATASEIAELLNDRKSKIRLIAVLDTLEYLKKGGRISSAVAIAGTLLSIKPIIAIQGGEVSLLGTARGAKNGRSKLSELIRKEGEIDLDSPYCLGYSGLSRELLDKYIAENTDLFPGEPDSLPVSSIGCGIGTHIGPGAIGACFFVK